ncbi:MAG: Dolichyl-phosphate beta-D-mannosyltransferase [Parcubacteria group bacterium GW2011_GWB1_57_6]|nr:MAG: Dolichyl-phosphate beta-D-mannosyltransferase [Parcubacteria group bacterium GW2011_GWB1_57_6]
MSKTVILLPTYNERENIRLIVSEIFAVDPHLGVMVIDDNSPDGTAEEVRALMREDPNLRLLLRRRENIHHGRGRFACDGISA